MPDLEFCHYYGVPSQYKKYKNFSNLLYHEKNHGIPAEWNFFATSHDKSPFDGIGGTTRRLVSHTSLQMNQILNINEMFDCCQEKITGIVFLKNIQSQIIKHIVSFNLNKWYRKDQNIHGSRVHNCFTPVDGAMKTRLISADDLHTATQPSFESEKDVAHINLGLYVAWIYDSDWYIGIEVTAKHSVGPQERQLLGSSI